MATINLLLSTQCWKRPAQLSPLIYGIIAQNILDLRWIKNIEYENFYFYFYFLNLLFFIVEVFSLVTFSQALFPRKSNQLVISSWEWTNSWVNYLLQGFQKIYTNMRLHFMIKYLIEVEMNIVQPTNVYQQMWIMNLIDPTIWILVT